MTMHNAPATVGYVRKVVVFTMIAFTLIVVGFNLKGDVEDADNSRRVCERGNDSRASELQQRENLVVVNIGRVQAADSVPEREANRFALASYRDDLQAQIDSQKSAAINPDVVIPPVDELLKLQDHKPLDVDPLSVTSDCEVVYPYPWPASVFD